jgi:hypothetical protein
MTNATDARTLTEAELNLVAGGVRDNPNSDYFAKLQADENSSGHTFGNAIYNAQFIGGGAPGRGHPIDF